jgi:hypothetical protein
MAEHPQPPLTRLQRRALNACQLSGYATPPEYVAHLSRSELFDLLDTQGEA